MKTLIAMLAVGLLAMTSLTLTGCGGEKDGDKGGDGGTPKAPTVLRVAGIPNAGSDQLKAEYAAMRDYLAKELAMDVQFTIVKNYDAAVAAIVNNQVDLCWLGGHTAVIAEEKMGDDLVWIATRDIDYDFKSYFICNEKHYEKLKGAKDLSVLKDMAKDLKLTFGSDGSTSGHLMPRHYLNRDGVPPSAFASFNYSGDHNKTLNLVADGTYDIGAMDMKVHDKATDDVKAKAPVFYVTDPGYTDYVWVASKRLGDDLANKVQAAITGLDMSNPEHKKVLDAWGAKAKFIKPDPKKWDDIRAVREALVKDGTFKR